MKLFAIFIISLLFLSCSPAPQRKIYFKMDTIIEITIFQERNIQKTEEIFAEIEKFLSDWDERFSPSSEKSEIVKINSRTNDTVKVSEDLFEMLETALRFSQKLDGAFDITIKPLKDFWNVGGAGEIFPDPRDTAILDTLAKILETVDYRKISLLQNPKRAVFENPETQIDLGGIAKGFALEKIREILENGGFENFIVNIGGDIFVSGEKGRHSPIIVGIRNPREAGVLRAFAGRGAVATSGDYERFRIAESGARVHHLFDTETGLPASQNISISITGKCAITADILATGLFSLCEKRIREKIYQFPNYEFLLVDSARNVFYSENFGK